MDKQPEVTTMLRSGRSILGLLAKLPVFCLVLCSFTHGQVLNQDQTIEVRDLPSLVARSPHSSDVLLTSLDTIFHDRDVCCGKDSALEDSVQRADSKSLKDVASKIQGRHLLSDGRPIKVTAEYLSPQDVNAGTLILMMKDQKAPLIEWNSHIYVVHGLEYFWIGYYGLDGGASPTTEIRKFLLWDTRYSDERRNVVFDRTTDDPKTVQGLLFVESKLQ